MGALDHDLMFTVGLVLAALSVPSVLAAHVESRPPWVAAVVFVLALGLMGTALLSMPAGLTLADVPDMVFRVIGRILN